MPSREADVPRPPGRPRSPAADEAILAAAFSLLQEKGFAAMSIEAVARAAGVGKTAIYRRYPSKVELAADAVRFAFRVDEVVETGDTRRDLAAWLSPPGDVISGAIGLLGTLLAEESEHPELIALFRERIARPRMAQAAEIIRSGIERGEVQPGIDPEAVSTALIGSLIARHLAALPEGDEAIAASIELIWQAIAAR